MTFFIIVGFLAALVVCGYTMFAGVVFVMMSGFGGSPWLGVVIFFIGLALMVCTFMYGPIDFNFGITN